MSIVALVRCTSYDQNEVDQAVLKGIDLLGSIHNFIKKGEKILLKPNILAGDYPEKCTCTHPAVFKAAVKLFKKAGGIVTYGDSPGFGSPESCAKKAGIFQAASEAGIALADFTKGRDKTFENGIQNKKFTIADGVLDCDGIISIPKFKTHGLERITGAVKNQLGCIPDLLKGEFHIKLPDAYDFARMLLDLNNMLKPRLYIMDGITAMEGNGPRGGSPKQMNVLIFSTDPIAVDITMCRLIDLNPEYVPTIKISEVFQSAGFDEKNIKYIGDDIKEFIDRTFDVVRKPKEHYSGRKKGLLKFISGLLVKKPYIVPDKCVRCGICITMCPVKTKAIYWKNNDKITPPVYAYSKCIRCYCCQEICPEGAIKLKTPFMRKLLRTP